MAKREVITLPSAQVEVDPRPGYLFVVESGQLRNMVELRAYHDAMEKVIERTGTRDALIDARGEIGDPPVEVREAMWSWLIDPDRGFGIVGFVLPTEMAVARVNMTALAQGAKVRAFDSVFAAQRWMARGPKFSTSANIRSPSSRPPAPAKDSPAHAPTLPAMPTPRRVSTPSTPGAYHTTKTKTEYPNAPVEQSSRRDEPKASGRDARSSDFRTTRPVPRDKGRGGDGGSQVA